MKTILPLIITILTVFILGSCRQENVSPIRNVRFDPKLLNPLKAAGACTNHSYFNGSKLRNLGTINTDRVVVAFNNNLTSAQQEQLLVKYGFVTGILSQRATQTGRMFTVTLANGLNCAQTEQAIRELKKDKAISYAGPSFRLEGNQEVGLSNEVMVKTDETGATALKLFAANYKAEVIGPMGADTYLVRVDKNSRGNALELATALRNQKGVMQAAPEFILGQ